MRKSKTASSKSYDLICVAHPDDETIFFGGLIQRLTKASPKRPVKVVCMTNGNADGEGAKRKKQFEKACGLLGVKGAEIWGFEDIYETRLPVTQIVKRLEVLPHPHSVFTHGIIGEYGHPHHQDVSFAVHTAFQNHPRVFSCAYNAEPGLKVELTRAEFKNKCAILTDTYGSETQRFLNLLPSTAFEGFLRLQTAEVEALYDYFTGLKPLKKTSLKAYAWLGDFLKTRRDQKRPF